MTAKAAAVLTAMLPSTLVKAENMGPAIFDFEVSSVAFPGGLDPRFFCRGSENAGIVLLESSQNDTKFRSYQKTQIIMGYLYGRLTTTIVLCFINFGLEKNFSSSLVALLVVLPVCY